MLVSSILSVLVSPASLKTPGILILLVLPGERNYCQAGFLQITVVMRGAVGGYCFESQLKCYCAIQSGIFPMGLTETQANICRDTQTLGSTSQPSLVAYRCEAVLAQSEVAQ